MSKGKGGAWREAWTKGHFELRSVWDGRKNKKQGKEMETAKG